LFDIISRFCHIGSRNRIGQQQNYGFNLSTHEKKQFKFMRIGAGFGGWASRGNFPGGGSIHSYQH
jgi:hypothetical protein